MYVQVGNSVFIKPLTVKSCNFFGNVVVNFFNCSSAFAYQWVRRSVLFIAFRTSCKVLNVNSCFSAQSFLTNKSIKNVKMFCIRVDTNSILYSLVFSFLQNSYSLRKCCLHAVLAHLSNKIKTRTRVLDHEDFFTDKPKQKKHWTKWKKASKTSIEIIRYD